MERFCICSPPELRRCRPAARRVRHHGAVLARPAHAKHASAGIVRPPSALAANLPHGRPLVDRGVTSTQSGAEFAQRERVRDPPLSNEKLVPAEGQVAVRFIHTAEPQEVLQTPGCRRNRGGSRGCLQGTAPRLAASARATASDWPASRRSDTSPSASRETCRQTDGGDSATESTLRRIGPDLLPWTPGWPDGPLARAGMRCGGLVQGLKRILAAPCVLTLPAAFTALGA